MNSIYTFFNGFKLDLNAIIGIGPIEKNSNSQIFIPIFCKGYNKPIEIVLGYSIGLTDQEQKNKINKEYTLFLAVFNNFNTQKNEQNHEKNNK
jgi:hypothetical protein